jgi:hypothetical protein
LDSMEERVLRSWLTTIFSRLAAISFNPTTTCARSNRVQWLCDGPVVAEVVTVAAFCVYDI